MAAAPNLPELARALEEEDLGRRTALAQLLDSTYDLSSDPPDKEVAFNHEIADSVLRELADVREAYIAAMKWVSMLDDTLVHVAIGERVNSLDDLCRVLEERWSL